MADGVLEKHSIMDELLAVLARTADGVFALDQAGQVVFWNAAAERITGYLADEVLGRPCYEIFGSEQRDGCHKCQPDCPVLRAARNQEPVPTYNVLGRTKTGVPILLSISVIVPPETGEYMYELLNRNAPLVEIPQAYHHLILDQPLAFIAALRALLADWEHSVPRRRAKIS